MKKSSKFALLIGILTSAALVASGCTSNFCTNLEKSRMLFAIDPGVSTYFASEEEAVAKEDGQYSYHIQKVFDDNDNLYQSIEYSNSDGLPYLNYTKSDQLITIFKNAANSKIKVPSITYFAALDKEVLTLAIEKYNVNVKEENRLSTSTITAEQTNEVLRNFGYVKFFGDPQNEKEVKKNNPSLWGYYDIINGRIASQLGVEVAPTHDFVNTYKTNMNSAVNATKSCIAIADGEYGNYGSAKDSADRTVHIDAKSWGYAWKKGPISGLIVWPVAALVDVIATSFAGGIGTSSMMAGWPQLLALLIVTVIVRLFILAVTFKSVLNQQKMQALQPELAKIQGKYPNSNTSQSEKQRLAEEQMKLYKKHKVNPLSQILIMFIQFPIFIGVWGAMSGSAVLSTGAFLNLNLSTSIWNALRNVKTLPSNAGGWWTALVLFLLMAVSQFLAMKLPQWISKAKAKKVSRLSVNPAQTQQNRTMNIVSYGMLIMIVIMGFTLPAAMGVYWFVGALFSLGQSLITQAFLGRKKHNK